MSEEDHLCLDGTTIILVRHGKTEWNAQERIQGSCDSPLTDHGLRSARVLGERLAASAERIDAVYSSPIGRAWHTAQIIAKCVALPEPTPDEELRERSFGVLEGLTNRQAKERFPEAERRNSSREDSYAPPGGESREACRARGCAALKRLAAKHPGQRLLIVSHSAFIACVMRDVLRQRHEPNMRIRSLGIPNTAINVLVWKGDGWQLKLWGDVGEFAGAPGGGRVDGRLVGLMCAAAALVGAAISTALHRVRT